MDRWSWITRRTPHSEICSTWWDFFFIVSFLNIINIITIFVMLLFAFPLLQSQSSGSIKFQGWLGAEGIREWEWKEAEFQLWRKLAISAHYYRDSRVSAHYYRGSLLIIIEGNISAMKSHSWVNLYRDSDLAFPPPCIESGNCHPSPGKALSLGWLVGPSVSHNFYTI